MTNYFKDEGLTMDKTIDGLQICYYRDFNNTFSLFPFANTTTQNTNALTTSLPFFIMQLFISNLVYRIFFYAARLVYLPPFVAQILCGLLLGPTGVGETIVFKNFIFPYRYTMVLETFANLSLVYYMFLVGLEMDLRLIRRSETKALGIAAAGILFPSVVGVVLYCLVQQVSVASEEALPGVFWAIVLSATNFPDLARILADLKLLRTDTGRTAMSAAIVTDLCTWLLFIVAVSAFTKHGKSFSLLSSLAFLLLCWFAVRPALAWAISSTTQKGHVSDNHIWLILAGVALFGLTTDACGSHSIVGSFMLGVIMPQGHMIKIILVEKLDDFVSGILIPLFFITSGLRSDILYSVKNTSGALIALAAVVGCLAKIVITFIVSALYGMPPKEGVALGLLMNTKGILALIILNAGRDMRVLDNRAFPLMVLVLLVMSCLVKPIIALTYRPQKLMLQYKHRIIEGIKQDTEFRILACVHNFRNATGIMNLLRASYPTMESPLCVFAVHLVELTGRTAASMLIMHENCKSTGSFSDGKKAEPDQIAEAFQSLGEENETVVVQTITAVSPYATMHEDICSLAEDKRVSFIILPFHKQLTADGTMGDENSDFASINHNVFKNAPCSVGLLVDRGMGVVRTESQHGSDHDHPGIVTRKQIAMCFIGGPDDREALTYAWRMAKDHTVRLTVVRFVTGEDAMRSISQDQDAASWQWYEREKHKDDECLYEFTFKTVNDPSISYLEKVVNDGQQTIAAIRELEDQYDLYIVGRGQGVNSPLTGGLSDWSSCPELGSIGDILSSSTFTLHASVLVVQQYLASNDDDDGFGTSASAQLATGSKLDAEPFMAQKERC